MICQKRSWKVQTLLSAALCWLWHASSSVHRVNLSWNREIRKLLQFAEQRVMLQLLNLPPHVPLSSSTDPSLQYCVRKQGKKHPLFCNSPLHSGVSLYSVVMLFQTAQSLHWINLMYMIWQWCSYCLFHVVCNHKPTYIPSPPPLWPLPVERRGELRRVGEGAWALLQNMPTSLWAANIIIAVSLLLWTFHLQLAQDLQG